MPASLLRYAAVLGLAGRPGVCWAWTVVAPARIVAKINAKTTLDPGTVANFRIIHSPPAAGRGCGPSARPDTSATRGACGKNMSAMLPPGYASQQAGTILPTLMLIPPVMPPGDIPSARISCCSREIQVARMIGNSIVIERHLANETQILRTMRTPQVAESPAVCADRLWNGGARGGEDSLRERRSSLQLTHICNRNVERKKQPGFRAMWSGPTMLQSVLNSDADIVIELIGGLNPAEQIVRRRSAGKSVVTANKQLIARHGPDLAAIGREKAMPAGVWRIGRGGVPVLPALRTGLSGDRLHGIAGILNGTCNYILSRIENARIPFSEALEEGSSRLCGGRRFGDLDGGDARAELAILALAGLHARGSGVGSGTDHSARSMQWILTMPPSGCTIRQISRADLKDDTLFADVGPCLVSKDSPFGECSAI